MITKNTPKFLPTSTRIESKWFYERGTWDDDLGNYVDVTLSDEESKTLGMALVQRDNGKWSLVFEGGPTGFESYYAEDLLNDNKPILSENFQFCICGGTINSFPRCFVNFREVKQFLDRNLLRTCKNGGGK